MEELVNSHVFTDFVAHLIRWLCTPNCISQLIFIVLVRVELVFFIVCNVVNGRYELLSHGPIVSCWHLMHSLNCTLGAKG